MNLTKSVSDNGFVVIEDVFTSFEVESIIKIIAEAGVQNETFRKSEDLFAIRQFLKEIPESASIIFNKRLQEIIDTSFGSNYVAVKSIYFDKPGQSNWFVSYHQDITISVDNKNDVEGFINWTVKQNQFAVQPPVSLLEDNFTIRIHLDDTDAENGALRILPSSHLKGICKIESAAKNNETVCAVKQGGIMIMKPLLFHASSRTTNNKQRRVIHIEFSKEKLPEGLSWSEYYNWRI